MSFLEKLQIKKTAEPKKKFIVGRPKKAKKERNLGPADAEDNLVFLKEKEDIEKEKKTKIIDKRDTGFDRGTFMKSINPMLSIKKSKKPLVTKSIAAKPVPELEPVLQSVSDFDPLPVPEPVPEPVLQSGSIRPFSSWTNEVQSPRRPEHIGRHRHSRQ